MLAAEVNDAQERGSWDTLIYDRHVAATRQLDERELNFLARRKKVNDHYLQLGHQRAVDDANMLEYQQMGINTVLILCTFRVWCFNMPINHCLSFALQGNRLEYRMIGGKECTPTVLRSDFSNGSWTESIT